MVLTAIGGALLGAVFGLRFKVLVLLPAILFGIVSIAVVSAVSTIPISTIVISAMTWTVTLQLGYLGGLFTRSVMVAARIRMPPRSHSLARASH
jgi:hypothetical protein